jgi:hypothetical protein
MRLPFCTIEINKKLTFATPRVLISAFPCSQSVLIFIELSHASQYSWALVRVLADALHATHHAWLDRLHAWLLGASDPPAARPAQMERDDEDDLLQRQYCVRRAMGHMFFQAATLVGAGG